MGRSRICCKPVGLPVGHHRRRENPFRVGTGQRPPSWFIMVTTPSHESRLSISTAVGLQIRFTTQDTQPRVSTISHEAMAHFNPLPREAHSNAQVSIPHSHILEDEPQPKEHFSCHHPHMSKNNSTFVRMLALYFHTTNVFYEHKLYLYP